MCTSTLALLCVHRVSMVSGGADGERVSDGLGDGLSAIARVSKALAIIVIIRVFFFIILLFFLSIWGFGCTDKT